MKSIEERLDELLGDLLRYRDPLLMDVYRFTPDEDIEYRRRMASAVRIVIEEHERHAGGDGELSAQLDRISALVESMDPALIRKIACMHILPNAGMIAMELDPRGVPYE